MPRYINPNKFEINESEDSGPIEDGFRHHRTTHATEIFQKFEHVLIYKISRSSEDMDSRRKVMQYMTLRSPTIHGISKFGKMLVYVLCLLNIRSWPLSWHFRVFGGVILHYIQHAFLRIRMLFMSRKAALHFEDGWLDTLCPIGAHPFKFAVPYRSWAGFDDCDFNWHLSNSSYAKVLDFARMKAGIWMFPMFFRIGGWMPVAATHFHFIREISIFQSYEIRTTIAAWDQKWIYFIAKIVCKGDKKEHHQRSSRPAQEGLPVAHIAALATGECNSQFRPATPASKTPIPNGVRHIIDTNVSLNAVATQLAGEEPDGAILHAIHIAQGCFKIGRITVPPNLAIAVNGFTGIQGHSLTNPHPQWLEAKKVMSKPMGGNSNRMRELMMGGWRRVPEQERWWDQAFGVEVEEQRVRNLSLMDGLRKGLHHLKTL